MSEDTSIPSERPRPSYRWPWLVGLASMLGVLLAVLWMSREVERTQRIRDATYPETPATGSNSTVSPTPGAGR